MLDSLKPQTSSAKKSKKKKKITILPEIAELESFQIVNFIGYTLLGLTLLDYFIILISPQFFNPVWEFQTIGRFIETSWASLLGLMLIFYRRKKSYIKLQELKFLSIISRLTLLAAIAYLLAVPLLISNTIRINSRYSAIANQQISSRLDRVNNFERQIEGKSELQLKQIMNNVAKENKKFEIVSPQEFKNKVITDLRTQEESSKQKIQQALQGQKNSLHKQAIKWILGTILTATSLLFIWKSTKWVRNLNRTFSK